MKQEIEMPRLNDPIAEAWLADAQKVRTDFSKLREAAMVAYGLLWNYSSDGSPNAKLATEARMLLRDQLDKDALRAGIQSAKETCDRIGAKFDPIAGGVYGP